MNGRNKRFYELRWDRRQPERLRHIHREEKKLPAVSLYRVRCYRPGGGAEERWFEGADPVETSTRAARWADENARRFVRVEVIRDAGQKIVYAR